MPGLSAQLVKQLRQDVDEMYRRLDRMINALLIAEEWLGNNSEAQPRPTTHASSRLRELASRLDAVSL
jgi:hypothetical protein